MMVPGMVGAGKVGVLARVTYGIGMAQIDQVKCLTENYTTKRDEVRKFGEF